MQTKANYKLKRKNTYMRKQLLIIMIILLCLISFTVIFGRYVTNNIRNFFIKSKEFYFYSDKLTEDGAIFQVENWSGVDDYIITVNMNSTQNTLEAATYDISYDVKYSCSDNAICQLSKTSGIIYSNTNTDFFNLTITPNRQLNTGDRVVVNIEATSTSEYTKTIKGTFTLVVGIENLSYEITDEEQSPYMELRMTNTLSYYTVNTAFGSYAVGDKIDIDDFLNLSAEDRSKCYSAEVTLSFDPNDILLDVTNEAYDVARDIETTTINGNIYINKMTISIEAISSRNVRFYKTDTSKNYTYPNGTNTSIVQVTSR